MENDKVKNILVIRFRRVGDAVLSSALCTSLKKTFPNAEVHYVLNKHIAPLFENHPDIDKLITFDDKELKSFPTYISKIWKIVHATKYDIIVDIRSTMNTIFFGLFSHTTKYRMAHVKSYNRLGYNFRLSNPLPTSIDIVDTNLDLLLPLENKFGLKRDKDFKLFITENEKALYKKYMESKGINFENPVITCTVATRIEGKALSTEKMSTILSQILEVHPEAQLIFNFSGAAEKEVALDIYNRLAKDKRVFVDIEANTLRDLAAMIANSHLLFGNEGGPRHIAQALGIPSFAIFPANIGKDKWLPNESEDNQGIELGNINMGRKGSKNVKIDSTEYDSLIDTDEVWNPFSKMLAKLFSETKN